MRAVVQRVKNASVKVDGELIGEIGRGIMLLLAVNVDDEDKDFNYIFSKILNLRIFDDEKGLMNKSLKDEGLELLVVSQFTLYGDGRKGNRPSYIKAAKAEKATYYYEKFIEEAKKEGIKTDHGKFGANMEVSLINDGPVTILLDSSKDF
ncbi:D-aminoacyl-tRNA deacylase [Peptoniphilus raoultii]|uniref:D-aminoacyl-tRNA deacylase n=1 Tax=Peptoniphilus raoultii TaxID=1776387 RepID=UPI0008D8F40F|nr:D-aminoacyl-tRNA deacylase [Peptoniphilus raoultii]